MASYFAFFITCLSSSLGFYHVLDGDSYPSFHPQILGSTSSDSSSLFLAALSRGPFLVFRPFFRCLDSLSPGTISVLSDRIAKGRAGFFDRAREKGSKRDRSGIDGRQVYKRLEDGTKRQYEDAMRS